MKTTTLAEFNFTDDAVQMHVRATEYVLDDGTMTWRVSWSNSDKRALMGAEALTVMKYTMRSDAVDVANDLIDEMISRLHDLRGLI